MLKRLLSVGVPIVALIGVFVMMYIAAQGVSVPVIDTRGVIADAQRDTLYFAVSTMLFVIVPVFILIVFVPWRYRASNKKAAYRPTWTNNLPLEMLWWGVPIIIVAILSVLALRTSHSLDPYRELKSDKPPIKVQVVALQWKWLFIYPEEGVASIGEFAMPVERPVNFTLTSDAPMNSFWIPQLAGQIYAMAGMSTKLHLNAREVGDYRGVSANLSGEGHASMKFTALARSESDYRAWLQNTKRNGTLLDAALYEQIRLPSKNQAVTYYRVEDSSLYNAIVGRYSGPHMNSQGGDN